MTDTSIEQAFRNLEAYLTELRNGVAHSLASERLIEKQLLLNRNMAETWLQRSEEKSERGEEKLAKVAIDQHQHHATVAVNFEQELQTIRDQGNVSTKLINQLDQISERFRVLHLLLSPIADLEKAQAHSYGELVDDVCALFKAKQEHSQLQPDESLNELESRLENLEGATLSGYQSVPAAELSRIVDSVMREKKQVEEDRRLNQQMADTWESRMQIASEMGEDELSLPAAARKKTYQFRVTHIDKSLKLLTGISALLAEKVKPS